MVGGVGEGAGHRGGFQRDIPMADPHRHGDLKRGQLRDGWPATNR